MSQIQIPKGWEIKKFGQLIKENKLGANFSKSKQSQNEKTPYLKMNNITNDGKLSLNDITYVDASEREIDEYRLEKGDLLFNTRNSFELVGKTAIWDGSLKNCIFNLNIMRIRFHTGILSNYINYYMISSVFRDQIKRSKQQTTNVCAIYAKDLFAQDILLPPLEIQKKIVQKLDDILGQLEEKKKEIFQIINKFDAKKIHQSYQNYLLNAAFSGKLTNEKLISSDDIKNPIPEGWELKKLEDVCVINPSKSEINHVSDATEITFVPMRYVDDERGIIDKKETRKLSEVKKGYTYFKENDVIFAKITPCMQNGKSAIGMGLTNGIGFGSTEFHVLRPSKTVLSKWVHYFVRNQSFLDEATNYFTGSAGQQRVPTSFLQSHTIPIPPLETQKKIIQILDEKFQDWDKYKQQIEDIEQRHYNIRKSIDSISSAILNSAFSGRLVN